MEKPDLEALMHENEELAFETLANAQDGLNCMWVVISHIADEEVVKAFQKLPQIRGRCIHVFHYERKEIETAVSRYQRFYKSHRGRLN